MKNLQGYKEQDVILFSEFIKHSNQPSLSKAFSEFAKKHNKAQGTIRNLYYAVAKKSREDSEFCKRYFDGKPIEVGSIEEFTKCQTNALISQVIAKKLKGLSVRSAILDIAKGDAVLALRYQNKFRNECNKNPMLIKEITEKLSRKMQVGGTIEEITNSERHDVKIKRLKAEINQLFCRVHEQLREENKGLKNRILLLERENARLVALLNGHDNAKTALRVMLNKSQREVLS